METRQLIAFLTVARTGSFTQAATELGFAQSSITAQIKGLEIAARVRLFTRGRQVRLTPAGERLLPFAQQILDLTDQAKSTVREDCPPFTRLTVGASEVLTTYRLPPLVESIHHRDPQVRLSLHTYRGGPVEVFQSLHAAAIDLGLVHSLGPLALRMPSVRIGTEVAILVAAPSMRERLNTRREADVHSAPMLITHPGCIWTTVYESTFGALNERASVPLQFGTVEGVKRGVVAGLGVSLLPRIAVRDLLDSGELVALPAYQPIPVTTYAVWAPPQDSSPIRHMFVDLATRAAAEDSAAGINEPLALLSA